MFIGGQGRTHTGQAIGVLAGAIQPGASANGIGLSFIAAQGDLTAQAQAGPLQLAAQDTVRLQSASRHIDWTAAKRIVLSVSGGASLTIDGSGITVQCPGKLTIQAAQKRLIEAGSVDAQLSPLPDGAGFQRRFVLRRLSDGQPLPAQRYRMTLADGRTIEGKTNEQGETELAASEGMQSVQLDLLQD